MLWKTVAAQRLKALRHLRAEKKLVTWRRNNGFDRCDARYEQWIRSSLPPTSEETTTSMWADVNALKKVTSMSEKERLKQRVKSFFNEIEQGTASLTDEEFARLERISWRGETALRRMWLLRQLVQPNSVTSDRGQRYHSMYMFIWRETTRADWTRSEVSSNHHRLVRVSSNHHRLVRVSSNHHRLERVLKHAAGSVSKAGRWNKPLLTATCSSA